MVKEATEDSNTGYRNYFGYLSYVYGETLLLKILHAFAGGHTEISLKETRKRPPCWLAFRMSEGDMQTAGERRNAMVLPNTGL